MFAGGTADARFDDLTPASAPFHAAQFLETIPPYRDTFSGRGIVICAGGVKYLSCAWVLINVLRQLGCQLPIEVWYLGEGECDANWIRLVESLHVTCVNAHDVRQHHPHPSLNGWELKSYAMLHSRFEEVLLLDADNVPTSDPTYLFDAPEYIETGAVFWPDPFDSDEQSEYWRVFEVPFRAEPEQESGQVLINKKIVWRALNLCDWYNRHSQFFYQYVYGDKDTFRLAWHRVGTRYAMPGRLEYKPYTICQGDFEGRLIFQHRHADKWSLAGNYNVAGFVHQDVCLALVQEFFCKWPVVDFLAGSISDDDRSVVAALAAKPFCFDRIGYNRWPMELSSLGTVDRGRSKLTFFWWVKNRCIIFAGDDGRHSYCLKETGNGNWAGESLVQRQMAVRMTRA